MMLLGILDAAKLLAGHCADICDVDSAFGIGLGECGHLCEELDVGDFSGFIIGADLIWG